MRQRLYGEVVAGAYAAVLYCDTYYAAPLIRHYQTIGVNKMKIKIQVKSDFMGEEYNEFDAIYSDNESELRIVWKDRLEGDSQNSIFEITYNKKSRELLMIRKGGIKSRMVFKQGSITHGVITSQYGSIPVDIDTSCLCIPNKVTNILKIEYSLSEGIENTFEVILKF